MPVALVAEKGVDAGACRSTLKMLRAAGASVPGVLWLDDTWRLDRPTDLAALHDGDRRDGQQRDRTRRGAAAARATARATGRRRVEEADATSSRRCRDAHFLDFTDGDKNALAKFPCIRRARARVTGTDSQLDGQRHARRPRVGARRRAAYRPSPTRSTTITTTRRRCRSAGAALAPIRGDATLRRTISTLDDGELVQGQVTAVIALEQLVGGTVGHYGYGQGAQIAFPRSEPMTKRSVARAALRHGRRDSGFARLRLRRACS